LVRLKACPCWRFTEYMESLRLVESRTECMEFLEPVENRPWDA
jgi:hypothetical protein